MTTNYVTTATGVSAICGCGRTSKPVATQADGRPSFWDLPQGWSCAPYPATHLHQDGTYGSQYVCPTCNRARSA
jgi:hypothetical protein